MPEEVDQVAARFREAFSAASAPLRDALVVHVAIQGWFDRFAEVLRASEREAEGLPPRWVWQARFVPFFEGFDRYETQLQDLNDMTFDAPNPTLGLATEVPARARITYAIGDFQFFQDPKTGQDEIAYDADTLKQWAASFKRWADQSARTLQAEIRRIG